MTEASLKEFSIGLNSVNEIYGIEAATKSIDRRSIYDPDYSGSKTGTQISFEEEDLAIKGTWSYRLLEIKKWP